MRRLPDGIRAFRSPQTYPVAVSDAPAHLTEEVRAETRRRESVEPDPEGRRTGIRRNLLWFPAVFGTLDAERIGLEEWGFVTWPRLGRHAR